LAIVSETRRWWRVTTLVALSGWASMAAADDAVQRDQPSASAASEQKPKLGVSDASHKPAILVFPLSLGTLPAGKSLTVVFRATINNPFTGNVPSVSNQGSISGSGFGPVLTDDPATGAVDDPTVTPIDLRPDLALSKSDGGASVIPGGTVAYTLSYSNLSSFGAPSVTLSETVPANTTFNAGASTAGWVCAPNGNAGSTCTLSLGTVNGLASGSAIFAASVVNPVAAGVTQISNTASIASTLPDPVPGNNTASDTTPVTAAPDLTLAKSDGGATVAPGGTVAYTLSYANAGTQGATGIVLTETVPANTTFNAGASTAGWICAPNGNPGSTCTLAIGALNGGGANSTATFALTVVNPVPAGVAQISNTASVADDGTNGADPTPANNSASDTTPVTAAPDLTLTKSDGGTSTIPGGTVAYTLSYANAGNQGAAGVVLTETVPANTTFNAGASTAGWVCTPNGNAGSTCTLAVGALNGGGTTGSATYAVTVVNPVPAGVTQISNTASIADDGTNGADPTPGNNTASDTTPVTATPDFTITKSDGGVSTTPGGTVGYTLSYANAGNQGATGVVLTETVPANTTFNAGASTAGWVCTPNGNAGSTCTLAVGALNGGGTTGSATYAVTVVDPIPAGVTQISNTASIADDGANGADPTPGNNSASDTTPVVAAPDLTIVKSDGGVSVAPGGTVSYTLAYTNAGNRGATGVTLTDVVPASTTFNAGASTAGWACTPNNNAGSSCTLSIGALAAAGNGSATFAVTVVTPAPAGLNQISNTATIADDGTNGTDPNTLNNTSTDTTPVTATPDLTLTKDDGSISSAPGGTVTYTLGYGNVGNQGATGVVLTDSVPANTTFLPGSSTAGWTCVPDNNAGSSCTLSVGALASTVVGSATFAVAVVNPVPAGVSQISNTASVADDGANGVDPTPGNNSATDTTPVSAAPDLVLVKSDGGASVAPGGSVAYSLAYRNDGNQGATGVVLTDTVPANTTFDAAGSTAGWACTPDNNPGSTCTLAVGALAGGGTAGSATYSVTVAATVPAGVTEITNTASVADDGANGSDPTPGNNTSTDTTPLVLAPDVTVSELVHGFSLVESLAALAGPVADEDVYRINQTPYSSYEVVIDATAGNISAGSGPVLERVAADGTTVLQTSNAVGTGASRSLRFVNNAATSDGLQTVRVRSAGCTTACGPETQYRLRAYETTYSIERFNNVAPQVTVVLIQNSGNVNVSGTVWLWNAAGTLVAQQPFSLVPRGVLALNTNGLAPGQSGSVTVSSDGQYGILAGKAAVLDPSAGPAQDVIMRPRVR
jgi:large repetitive protein